jgi:uncharacterized protein (TIRG00374 family)
MKNPVYGYLESHKVWQKLGLLVLLGLAVHLILPQITSLEKSWQVLTTLLPWAVALAFVAQFLSYLGSGYLLQNLIDLSKQSVSLLRSTLIFLGATSIGMVAGGFVGSATAIYRWTNTDKNHSESATLASILPSLLNNLLLVLVSIFGMVYLLIAHDLSKTQVVEFITILLLLILFTAVIALGLYFRDRSTSFILWFVRKIMFLRRKSFDPSPIKDAIKDFFTIWENFRRGEWHKPVIGAILNVVFDMVTLYLLFIASGNRITPGTLLAGYGLPLLLGKMAFVIPGGVGVVESSMVAIYDSLGIADPHTVVVVLGYRLISFWLPSIAGFPVAGFLQSL